MVYAKIHDGVCEDGNMFVDIVFYGNTDGVIEEDIALCNALAANFNPVVYVGSTNFLQMTIDETVGVSEDSYIEYALQTLAENGFIPVSETFFYKP